jgi:hypothetical protein
MFFTSAMEMLHVGRDETKHEGHEFMEDLPRTLAAFWGNQLERIKQDVEGQVNRASTREGVMGTSGPIPAGQ